jgi:hypothetical protein
VFYVPLAEDLREHAWTLLDGLPREVQLRRSVSAAYYALFHLLSSAVAEQLSPDLPAGLRGRTQRALDHGQMASAARNFSAPGKTPMNLPKDIGLSELISPRLANVAQSFVDLQEARYLADYDVLNAAGEINLRWAQESLAKADAAFRDWNMEKNSEGARVFLAALMLGKHWGKKN